jgi:hypothetical protein
MVLLRIEEGRKFDQNQEYGHKINVQKFDQKLDQNQESNHGINN